MIDFNLIQESLPSLLQATYVTIAIAFLSCVVGVGIGTCIAIAQLSSARIIQGIAHVYVTIIRGTPMLIQISFWYFALRFDPFFSAVLGIGLNSGAYVSQIVRAGINSVGRGQVEAAQVLGFSHQQIIWLIILPQAVRAVIPALGNELITLIKDSSLASTIGVVELYRQASFIRGRTYDVLSVYCILAVIYLVLTGTMSYIVSIIERKMQHARH